MARGRRTSEAEAAEERHRRILENVSDLIAEIDEKGTFLFVSPNCEAVVGVPAEEVVGRTMWDSEIFQNVHPEDQPLLAEAFSDGRGAERQQETVYRYRHRDGRWRWFQSRGRTFVSGAGWRAVVVSRDVTDREEALRRLRQSEERYRVLAEATHDLVSEVDADGKVLYVSPSCERLLGYTPEEMLQIVPYSLVHPDDVPRLIRAFERNIQHPDRPHRGVRYRVRRRDGEWLWLEGSGVGYESFDGEIHLVSVSRDLTEQLRAEAEHRQLQDWMQQAQKFESLGMMASGIAHDFNNLLTPILGDASLALLDLPADSPARTRLEKIQRAAGHAAALTKQLLDYAGVGSLDVEPVDLSALVLDLGQLLEGAVSRNAQIVFELGEGLAPVAADPAQLSQVVLNLITNASEAVEAAARGRGHVTIRTGVDQLEGASLSGRVIGEGLDGGPYAWFEVEDDGCGMDAETRSRVFDPFFSTKFTGRGLGLAAVLGIVRKHRGALQVESQAGVGTRVRAWLPLSAAEVPRRAAREPEAEPAPLTGTVLVADDDEAIRELISETLARAGLEVYQAADGAEAVERFKAHADGIQLVLLDCTMPGTRGEEALDAIQALRPEVPVVLVSGYSELGTARRFAGRKVAAFLHKPFLPQALLERVRALLSD